MQQYRRHDNLQLEQHGLRWIMPEVALTVLSPEGSPLILYRDLERAAADIRRFSPSDADQYREFHVALEKTSRAISKALSLTPPEIERPTRSDIFGLLQIGGSLRGLGRKNIYNLLRWAPMAVALTANIHLCSTWPPPRLFSPGPAI